MKQNRWEWYASSTEIEVRFCFKTGPLGAEVLSSPGPLVAAISLCGMENWNCMMRINELVLPADDTVSCEWFSSHCDVCHVWSSTSSCLNNAIPAVGRAFPRWALKCLGSKSLIKLTYLHHMHLERCWNILLCGEGKNRMVYFLHQDWGTRLH